MGWEVKRLEEVFDIARGGSPRPIKSYITDAEDGINWIKISDATASSKYITETKEKIKPEGKSRSRYVKKGDFLLSNSMSFGRPYIMGTDGCIHDGWLVLSPKEVDHVDQNFLYYLLGSPLVFRQFDSRAAGSTVRNLNIGLASSVEIPVPPFEEQKKIVAILDQVFAEIDQARANAEQNLKNARELFDSYLNQVFSQRGEGWEYVKLGELAQNLDSKRVPITKKDRVAGPYPYYGASGVVDHVDDYLFDDELLLVSEDGANLLARTYPIAFTASGKFWVNNHAHVLKFDDRNIHKAVEYYLNSISLEPYISGMAQPKLNQQKLNSIMIPAFNSKSAESLNRKLDSLSENIKKMEVINRTKITYSEELKKSILHKAFSGELT